MSHRSVLTGLVLAAAMSAAASGQTGASRGSSNNHALVRPETLTWTSLRPGAEMAVVAGDPARAGEPFVLRFRYKGVVRVPPHWHPTDEHITVLAGAFMVGMGATVNEASATELGPGAYALLPAKMPHYAWSKGDTLLQVHGIGPFSINYVNPADDPRNAGR
jgi:hypothetical protein